MGSGGILERGKAGGGNVMSLHELLGKFLRALQLGASLTRTEDSQTA